MKILITGANNAKTMKLLKAFPNHFILLADYGEVPGIITGNYAFTSIGILNKESIAHILLNFCITESVDSIIPLYDYEVEPLAKSAVLFSEYNIQVLLPNADKIEQFLNNENIKYNDFVVFINGECIFSTNQNLPDKETQHLNGVFGFNNEGYTLFTI